MLPSSYNKKNWIKKLVSNSRIALIDRKTIAVDNVVSTSSIYFNYLIGF